MTGILVALAATLAVPSRSLQVTTVTTGQDLDANGYQASLWKESMWGMSWVDFIDLPANGVVTVSELDPVRDYLLEVYGAAPNCEIVSANPVRFTVGGWWQPGAAVEIDVQCARPARLAFASDTAGENPDIYVVNSNGTAEARLTWDPAWDVAPAWSPDGTKIAFQSHRTGAPEIYVMNADGSSPVQLTATGASFRPAWSPDGMRIAFTSARDGNSDVYVIGVDGNGLVNLTNHPAEDADPAWSPDGTRLAFRSDRVFSGFPGIYLMNPDGSGVTRLTNEGFGGFDLQPAWSPDGRFIAVSRFWPSEWSVQTIWRMSASDGSAEPITGPSSFCEAHFDPAWSPDGEQIAFTSTDGCWGTSTINVVRLDDPEAYSSGETIAAGVNPSWRR